MAEIRVYSALPFQTTNSPCLSIPTPLILQIQPDNVHFALSAG